MSGKHMHRCAADDRTVVPAWQPSHRNDSAKGAFTGLAEQSLVDGVCLSSPEAALHWVFTQLPRSVFCCQRVCLSGHLTRNDL